MRAKDIRIAVIGYGASYGMGYSHLKQAQAAGMTPAAVVDVDCARRDAAAADWPGIEIYDSVEAMLKSSDANLAVLITPHNSHAALALQCLRSGLHVVTEKPMAITTAECDRMMKAAAAKDLMLSTFHNRHWDGCILEALRRIRGGAIGDIRRIEAHKGSYGSPGDIWRASKSISGGILYDWGVHLLEWILQLVDSEITEVSGYATSGLWSQETQWKKDANEDEAMAVIRFGNGTWASVSITTLDSNPKPSVLEITGTRGTYLMNHRDYRIVQPRRRGQTLVTEGNTPTNYGERYYKNVARHLTRGDELVITAEWARRAIHVLDLADRSVREGRAQKARYV
jgi:predicted dehydrogenase